MKRSSTFFLASGLFFMLSVTSCSSDDDSVDEPKGIAVQSVQATSCVSLSERQDWILRLGSVWAAPSYQFTTAGKNLVGTPQNENECFHFNKKYMEGELPYMGYIPSTSIYLTHKEYYPSNSTRTNVVLILPDVCDQSTLEGLKKADALYGGYKGVITSHITGIELIHRNTLLEFACTDMPDNYQIILPLDNSLGYTPYKVGLDSYKVICLSGGLSQNIGIRVGSDTYQADSELALKADTHYKFTLRFDKIQKKLLIENLVETVWSEEEESLSENVNK
ncbi:MAG TPA: hypothetical protein K8W04_09500 [Bacteroides reticulotermitis]|nr:hypothetical protein [Bacteroides reticulotermitis]